MLDAGGDVLVPLLILVAGQRHTASPRRLLGSGCHGALTTSRCAGFPIGTAVALSNVGVFGGGVGNFILNVRRRHPKEDKPLIDW